VRNPPRGEIIREVTICLVNGVQRQRQRCLERRDIFILGEFIMGIGLHEHEMRYTSTASAGETNSRWGSIYNTLCAWCPAAKNGVSKRETFSYREKVYNGVVDEMWYTYTAGETNLC